MKPTTAVLYMFVALGAATPINVTLEARGNGRDCGGLCKDPAVSPLGRRRRVAEADENNPGTVYTLQEVEDAYGDAARRYRRGQDLYNGNVAYPKVFYNLEELDASPCKGRKLIEFPIEKGREYAGGMPGNDRVVIAESNKPGTPLALENCFVMTHTGAPPEPKNGFVRCT